jgi:hypothetical protein
MKDFGGTVQPLSENAEGDFPVHALDPLSVVIAGPGSSITIPGIIVSEIALALAQFTSVTRIEVDLGAHASVGLHRAPSLAAAQAETVEKQMVRYGAPPKARSRTKVFASRIDATVGTAIAYAWPGIDNEWIKSFLKVAESAGVSTTVACASLPPARNADAYKMSRLASLLAPADRVVVGDEADAAELAAAIGSSGPIIESHRALSLRGRTVRPAGHEITAFLPKNDSRALSTLLAAFDAIPEAWIAGYRLHVVMRYVDQTIPDLIARSHHTHQIRLVSDDLSADDLDVLIAGSSVLAVAHPAPDSRAFSAAVGGGIATVVLVDSSLPAVGGGYVGGLIADLHQPASVHVALAHALRLAELGFPPPNVWRELAEQLIASRPHAGNGRR